MASDGNSVVASPEADRDFHADVLARPGHHLHHALVRASNWTGASKSSMFILAFGGIAQR